MVCLSQSWVPCGLQQRASFWDRDLKSKHEGQVGGMAVAAELDAEVEGNSWEDTGMLGRTSLPPSAGKSGMV